jgi:aarF domain-containing kinase
LRQGQSMWLDAGPTHAPPAELLFLQRKFVGTFMLCVRLGACFDVSALFDDKLS